MIDRNGNESWGDPDEVEGQFEVTLFWVHSTANAICVAETDDLDAKEVWLPKSAIAFERQGTRVTVWAPEKMLVDKGLV